MPSKTKTKNAAIAAKTAALSKIPKELLDQVVAGGAPMTAEQINSTTVRRLQAVAEETVTFDAAPDGAGISCLQRQAKPRAM